MKKLVFVAFAAFVMVSVSNVFAGSSKAELGLNMPVDTTVVDTADTVGEPEQQATPGEVAMLSDSTDSVDSTAQLFSSVMLMDSTSTDTTGTEAPAVV